MARIPGMVISSNYETSLRRPLDSRQMVTTKEDLINPTAWQFSSTNATNSIYDGMITAVQKDGVYVLNNRRGITADNYAAYQAAVEAGTDVASYFSMWTKIASIETVENLVATVGNAVEAVVGDLTKLTERVVANETAIAELEGTVTEMGTLVNEVKATAETADGKADAAQVTAETAIENAAAAQATADDAKAEAEAATAAAATNKADIETLRSDVSAAQSDIELLKAGEMGGAANVSYPTVEDLPTEGEGNIVYIVEEENALYRWDDATASYVAVGRDYAEVVVIDGGGANI